MATPQPPNDRASGSGKRPRKRSLFDLAGRIRLRPDFDYREMRRLRDVGDVPGRPAGSLNSAEPVPQDSQFSTDRPATRSKCLVLAVTTVSPRASAIPAMRESASPIGVP